MTQGPFVKVCGVTRVEDARRAAGLGAGAIGLVFHPESPRRVDAATARRIAAALPAGVLAVGVFAAFAAEEMKGIRAAVRAAGLDLVQLHGPGAAAAARRLGPTRCIVAVTSAREEAAALASGAAYLVVDRPRTGGVPRGSRADPALARRLARAHPRVLLAGGLDASNVARAVADTGPFGVDVSGGVERTGSPGVKDPERLEAFFGAIPKRKVRHAASP